MPSVRILQIFHLEFSHSELWNKVYFLFAIVKIGPDGLREPCVLACLMRSLAIVITIVQSFFLSFGPGGRDRTLAVKSFPEVGLK